MVVCESVPTSVSGISDAAADHDDSGQVLDVDLVHDAGPGRDDLELVECRLAPAQELVALLVALVLQLDVAFEGVGPAEHVRDHGVVDDHLGRRQRVDLVRIAAEVGHGLAHGGQVDDAGHAGEVLHDHPGRSELDLGVRFSVGLPIGQGQDVFAGDVRAVLGADQVLQQHLQRVGQLRCVLQPGYPLDLVDLVVLIGAAGADGEGFSGAEAVLAGRHAFLLQEGRNRSARCGGTRRRAGWTRGGSRVRRC